MKNFVHKITCVLVMCAATVAFTACSDSDNKGDGPVTGTLSVETGALVVAVATCRKRYRGSAHDEHTGNFVHKIFHK